MDGVVVLDMIEKGEDNLAFEYGIAMRSDEESDNRSGIGIAHLQH